MVGGDRALLCEMIKLFVEDYPKRVTEITEALRRNDAEAVEFAAHAVKGAAMTLCAPRVAKWAVSIEKMGRDGGVTREAVRKETAKPKAGRPKHYVFAFRPPTKAFNLKLSFNKSRASREDVIDALEAILRDLRKNK